uniref:Uncharacterized protein n=1 Tax=Lepeophtheirus salmonis TaxID=72036 RepID=A0A0K2VCY1_LEPSM
MFITFFEFLDEYSSASNRVRQNTCCIFHRWK